MKDIFVLERNPLRPRGDIMHLYYIAQRKIRKVNFDNSLAWQIHNLKRRNIMPIHEKIWIAIILYMTYLFCMELLSITLITKSL